MQVLLNVQIFAEVPNFHFHSEEKCEYRTNTVARNKKCGADL